MSQFAVPVAMELRLHGMLPEWVSYSMTGPDLLWHCIKQPKCLCQKPCILGVIPRNACCMIVGACDCIITLFALSSSTYVLVENLRQPWSMQAAAVVSMYVCAAPATQLAQAGSVDGESQRSHQKTTHKTANATSLAASHTLSAK